MKLRRYASTDLKQHLGDVLDAASREPIAITKHNKARFVLMSVEAYEAKLSRDPRRAHATAEMPAEHLALIEKTLTSSDD